MYTRTEHFACFNFNSRVLCVLKAVLVLSHQFQQSDWSVYVAVSVYSTSYLMSVGSDGHTKGSSQSKVCKFDHTLRTDEQVLRLQVSMQDAMRMTELNGIENLVDIAL